MSVQILQGDCLEVLKTLPDKSVSCCVTSPPYWNLRDYGCDGQIGREETPEAYVALLVNVFEEVKRALKDDGTLWLNLGDGYAKSNTVSLVNNPSNKNTLCNGRGSHSGHKYHIDSQKITKNKVRHDAKPKDLLGIPFMVAFALRNAGWYWRAPIIWHKPNPMPESVKDRPTMAHEYIWLMSKKPKYYYDHEAIAEPLKKSSVTRLSQDIGNQKGSDRANGGTKTNGKMKPVVFGGNKAKGYGTRRHSGNEYIAEKKANKRTIWSIANHGFKEAHFATFPPKLVEPCILAGCPKGGTVLDPFFGAGTTGLVADSLGRNCVGIELNPEYIEIAKRRIEGK